MEKKSQISIIQSAIDRFRPNCPDDYKMAIIKLYENTHALLDKNFIDQIQVNFPSRLAKLVFSYALKFQLGLNPKHISDAGPDLWLDSIL